MKTLCEEYATQVTAFDLRSKELIFRYTFRATYNITEYNKPGKGKYIKITLPNVGISIDKVINMEGNGRTFYYDSVIIDTDMLSIPKLYFIKNGKRIVEMWLEYER